MTSARAASLSDPILYGPGTTLSLSVTFPVSYDLSGKWLEFVVKKSPSGSTLLRIDDDNAALSVDGQVATATIEPTTTNDISGGLTLQELAKADSTLAFAFNFGDDTNTELAEYRVQGDILVAANAGAFDSDTSATDLTVNFESSSVTVSFAGQGPKGDDGAAGPGLPAGGTVGQIPTKASATDYDVEWTNAGAGDMVAANNLSELTDAAAARNNLGLGTAATSDTGDFATAAQGATADTAIQPADISGLTGGTTGQIPTKASGDDYDLAWADDLTVPGLLTADHIHGNIAGTLYIHVKNTSGGTLAKGTPVYVTGHVGSSDRVEVAAADQSDPAKMPAIALLAQDLANNGEGDGVIVGEIRTYDTDTPGWALNDELFVGTSGLTSTRPTTGTVQPVATVGRIQASTGVLVINCQGQRTPDESFADATHSHTLADITDAGTAAASDTGDFATAAQGSLADSALQSADIDTLAELNSIVTDATLIDTTDSRLSDSRTCDNTFDDAATARTNLGVDPAGTDNSTDVTLAGSLDYLSLSGQEITLGSVDLTTDVTGTLPIANGGTGVTALSSLDAASFGAGASSDGQVLTSDGAGGAAWEDAGGGGISTGKAIAMAIVFG